MVDITRGFGYIPILVVSGIVTGFTSYKNYECSTVDFAYGEPITIEESPLEGRILSNCYSQTYTYTPAYQKNTDMCIAMYAASFISEALFFVFLGQALTKIFLPSATAMIAPAINHAAVVATAIAPQALSELVGFDATGKEEA